MSKKRVYIKSIFLCLLFSISVFGYAGKRYWVGTGANVNWNSTTNWSTSSGGGSGASVPSTTDSVYFDGNGTGQCSLNATVSIRRFEIGSGYTDTVKQNSNTITVGTSGMILNGGVFKGGNANITNQGIFSLAGCSFISTSAIISIAGNYTYSSGSFIHNNGELRFTATSTITGNTSFYKLNFSPASTATYTINSTDTLTVNNLFKISGTVTLAINSGSIKALGDIEIANTYNSTSSGGSATLIIKGSGTQTIDGADGLGKGRLCNVKIEKLSADTLTLKEIINIGGNWTYVSGVINASTYNSTVGFCYPSKSIYGSHTLNNVTFYSPANTIYILNTSDTLTVIGTLTTSSSFSSTLNGGTINLKGDLDINSTGTNNTGGSSTIVFSGTSNQTIFGSSTRHQGHLCNIKINKSNGSVILKDKITIGNTRTWKLLSGTLDVLTYDSEVILIGTTSLEGNQTFKNLTYSSQGASTSLLSIPINDTVKVNDELLLEGSTYFAVPYTGNIHAKGDITVTNSATALVNTTAIIKINGTGDQMITGTASPSGKICSITIDKPSGTLILKNFITFCNSSSWKLVNGTIDANSYPSTLVFNRGTQSIEGKQTLNNILFSSSVSTGTYNIGTSDTITIAGELKTEGSAYLSFNGGVLKSKGDINITNTFSGTGTTATATLLIAGASSQTLTGSGITNGGKLCSIKIDKASGTLNLNSIISVDESWNYIKGNVVPGSSTVVFNGGGSAGINAVGSSSSMNFNNVSTFSTLILNSNLACNGDFKINASSTVNGNSKTISIGGNWDNSGTFTYANTNVTFNGSGKQRTIKSSGTENFYDLTINKSSQNLLIGSPISVNNHLLLVKGAIGTTNTNYINIPNDKTVSGGSDSSYVCGPIRKTGNDAFTFPTGDTLLSSGAYHPIVISAPSVTTDAFTAQYYSSTQTSGSTLQTDSLSSISNCEHWLLTRTTGTSTVTPSLGWNTNSCNLDLCHKMRVAGWNGSQWNSLGISSLSPTGNTGLIAAAYGLNTNSLPLVIARTVNSSLYPSISVSISVDTICSGDSTILTASGTTTYSWSPSTGLSSTSGSIVNAAPAVTTTYTVIGTNTYGCTDTSLITVYVLSVPNLLVSPSFSSLNACSSSGKTLIASGAITYSWLPTTGLNSTVNDTVIAFPTSSTTYTVTGIASNGCIKTATAVILVSSTYNISISGTGFTSFVSQCSDGRFPPVICNYSATACRDSSLTLNATGCPNPNLIYTWAMGDSTVLSGDTVSYSYSGLINDTITLTVIDTTGNLDTVTKYIPITIYPCLPACCQNPYLYVSDTALLDTAINVSLNSTIFLCDNLSYTFSSSCYNEDTVSVTWVFSDTDTLTNDSTYTGNSFTMHVGNGTYTLTMSSYGAECDTSVTEVTIQTMSCEPSCADCLGSFSPVPGKKYILSAWVKEENALPTKTTYTYPEIIIASPSASYAVSASPQGRIIDGWQRVEKEFTLPTSATDIHIELKCSTGNCFFDDVRVFPVDGSMKSYVYDPVNLRLSAELDERNYATFYEYDEEGKLIRVKKETEKGTMTIKENRNKTKK